jgi:hypothetical protein
MENNRYYGNCNSIDKQKPHKKMIKHASVILFCATLIISGCKSDADKKIVEERKRLLIKREKEQEEKEVKMQGYYKAIYFPDSSFKGEYTTYDIQKFFLNNMGSNIVFECNFIDAELKGESGVLEFSCPINYNNDIRLRLRATNIITEEFIADYKKSIGNGKSVSVKSKKYIIVAKISKAGRLLYYKTGAELDGEEVLIENDELVYHYAEGTIVRYEHNQDSK